MCASVAQWIGRVFPNIDKERKQHFIPIDVKYPNKLFRFDSCYHSSVDMLNNPFEKLRVNMFGKSITSNISLNEINKFVTEI